MDGCHVYPPHIEDAHSELEEAIKVFLQKTGRDADILVDWVLITAQLVQTEHAGHDHTICGWSAGLNQQLYRTKGLLTETLDNFTAQDVAHFLEGPNG